MWNGGTAVGARNVVTALAQPGHEDGGDSAKAVYPSEEASTAVSRRDHDVPGKCSPIPGRCPTGVTREVPNRDDTLLPSDCIP